MWRWAWWVLVLTVMLGVLDALSDSECPRVFDNAINNAEILPGSPISSPEALLRNVGYLGRPTVPELLLFLLVLLGFAMLVVWFSTGFRVCVLVSPLLPQNPLEKVGGEAPHFFQWECYMTNTMFCLRSHIGSRHSFAHRPRPT